MASVTIGRRFTQLIQHLGISKNAFAQSLGKTATVIQHLVDERNKPGYDLLCKVFEVYPDVSKDWLLLGQGPMLTSFPTPPPAAILAPTPPAAAPAEVSQAAVPAAVAAADLPASARATDRSVAANQSGPVLAQAPASELASEAVPSVSVPPPVAAPPSATPTSVGVSEALLSGALHAQHLQHQLALAEQRNQHLLEQQRLMQQLLDFAQRR